MMTSERGPIFNGGIYPLSVFRAMTGLGEEAMREARRRGLVVRQVGSRRFVTGQDFWAFLTSLQNERPYPGVSIVETSCSQCDSESVCDMIYDPATGTSRSDADVFELICDDCLAERECLLAHDDFRPAG